MRVVPTERQSGGAVSASGNDDEEMRLIAADVRKKKIFRSCIFMVRRKVDKSLLLSRLYSFLIGFEDLGVHFGPARRPGHA